MVPFICFQSDFCCWLYSDAIQLAKLSGYTVVTTASSKNFDLVKSFGADAVYSCMLPHLLFFRFQFFVLTRLVCVDSDPETPAKIRAAYPTLKYALDTVSEGDTTKKIVDSLGEKATGKRVIRLLPGDEEVGGADVKVEFTVVCKPLF